MGCFSRARCVGVAPPVTNVVGRVFLSPPHLEVRTELVPRHAEVAVASTAVYTVGQARARVVGRGRVGVDVKLVGGAVVEPRTVLPGGRGRRRGVLSRHAGGGEEKDAERGERETRREVTTKTPRRRCRSPQLHVPVAAGGGRARRRGALLGMKMKICIQCLYLSSYSTIGVSSSSGVGTTSSTRMIRVLYSYRPCPFFPVVSPYSYSPSTVPPLFLVIGAGRGALFFTHLYVYVV